MNEASMALDDDVNVEMHRLRTEAALDLCYVSLYKTDPGKIKIAFNNVLAADAIGFAETRLCRRDENVHYALKMFRLIRLDDAEKESGNRPHHGLALYVKEYFQIQKVVKMQCKSNSYLNSYLLAHTAFKEGMFKLSCFTNTLEGHRQILERIFIII